MSVAGFEGLKLREHWGTVGPEIGGSFSQEPFYGSHYSVNRFRRVFSLLTILAVLAVLAVSTRFRYSRLVRGKIFSTRHPY